MPRKSDRKIIQKYVNNTEWYNLYSDGWCEQGGWFSQTTGQVNISYLLTFLNTNYTLKATPLGSDNRSNLGCPMYWNKTVTGFTSYYQDSYYSTGGVNWEVCGYTSLTNQNYLEFYLN